MGYEDAYRAFEQTRQQAMALSDSIGERPADDAMGDGAILFARMVIQAHSLKKILPDVDRPVQGIDISSCSSITRNLAETFLVLFDRWLEEVPPSVRRFRELFWNYHQKKEEIRGLNLVRVFHGKEPYDEDLYTQDAKCALDVDPEFCRLEDKRRAHLCNKSEPCVRGQQTIAVAAGISAERFDGTISCSLRFRIQTAFVSVQWMLQHWPTMSGRFGLLKLHGSRRPIWSWLCLG